MLVGELVMLNSMYIQCSRSTATVTKITYNIIFNDDSYKRFVFSALMF